MDSLKSLLDKRQYELVLKLTENTELANDLFYRIAAFMFLARYEDALFVIQDHQKEMEMHNMNTTITLHIELLCALDRFDQARAVLSYYNELPYQSQIVEETLAKMPEVINKEEHKKIIMNSKSEDEIIDLLHSNNNEDVLFGLDLIKKLDHKLFFHDIKKILIEGRTQTIRSFALMLLVSKDVNCELGFNSYNGLITVNPSACVPPFTGDCFNRFIKTIDTQFKDVGLAQTATQLLSNLVIYTYPSQLPNENTKNVIGALFLYSKLLFGEKLNVLDYSKNNNLDSNIVTEYFDLIDKAANDL